jgi:ankyrin repeat protein
MSTLSVCPYADFRVRIILIINWNADDDHDTALDDASAKGNVEVVNYLVERGADFKPLSMSLAHFKITLRSHRDPRSPQRDCPA